jgi:hypothetical protein
MLVVVYFIADAAIQEIEPSGDESKKKRKKGHTEDYDDGNSSFQKIFAN